MNFNRLKTGIFLFLFAFLAVACGDTHADSTLDTEIISEFTTITQNENSSTEETTTEAEIVVKTANLAFVGDILPHTPVIRLVDTGDDYDFTPCFNYVSEQIAGNDYSVCNLETTLAGAGKGRNLGYTYEGYSGYPTFNSPSVLARDLKKVGFDLLLNANNHSLDSYESGIFSTINAIEENGLDHIGTRKFESDKTYLLKSINGIDFAFTNYTYGMNGFNLSAENAFAVNHWNNYDDSYIEEMLKNIEQMVAENADINIACLHFGVEYGLLPDEKTQKEIANKLFDAGIDLIIGDHSHTLQPFEVIERGGEKKFIIYSLGNFLSNQIYTLVNQPGDFGGILELEIEKINDDKAELTSFAFTPTYCLVRSDNHYILPVMVLPKDFSLTNYDYNRLEHFKTVILPRITSLIAMDYQVDGQRLVYDLKKEE